MVVHDFGFDQRCAYPCGFLVLVFFFRLTLPPDLYIGVSTLTGRYSLDVAADCAGYLGATAASLLLDHAEIVRKQSMTRDRAAVGNTSKGANYARANEEREVKTVLRVPFRS